PPHQLHSFPTRRSSDLFADDRLLLLCQHFHLLAPRGNAAALSEIFYAYGLERLLVRRGTDSAQRFIAELFVRVRHGRYAAFLFLDRKSTRLNSSHVSIS